MARLSIDDYESLGCEGYPTAATWQVFLDEERTQLIDETVHDEVNVMEWHSMLPKVDGVGYYSILDKLYGRVKLFIDDIESDWFDIDVVNQNEQTILITEEGQPDRYINKIEIGMRK